MRLVWTLPLLALLTLATPAAAKTEVADRVVAVVDREPILLSQLMKRARAMVIRSGKPAQTYNETLQRMIEERLLEHHAKDQKVVVTEAETEEAFDNVRKQQNMTREELVAGVKQQLDMSEAEYKRQLKLQLLRFKLFRLEVKEWPVGVKAVEEAMDKAGRALLLRLKAQRYVVVRVTFE